jgi:glycosyltransferase involved in cell wall biosynthesis
LQSTRRRKFEVRGIKGTLEALILIPSFNGERFIIESLSAALKQTHKNTRVLVSDDCSSDSTIKLLDDFRKESDYVFEIEQNDVNVGPHGNSFNAIKKFGKSDELIIVVGQDDILPATHVADVVSLINKKTSVVTQRALVIDELGKRAGNDLCPIFFTKIKIIDIALMLTSNFVIGPGAAVPYSKYVEIIPGQRGDFTDDWAFFTNALLRGRIRSSVKSSILYRRHDKNLSIDRGYEAAHDDSWNWRIQFLKSSRFQRLIQTKSKLTIQLFVFILEAQIEQMAECEHSREFTHLLRDLINKPISPPSTPLINVCRLQAPVKKSSIAKNHQVMNFYSHKEGLFWNLFRISLASLVVYRRFTINILKSILVIKRKSNA